MIGVIAAFSVMVSPPLEAAAHACMKLPEERADREARMRVTPYIYISRTGALSIAAYLPHIDPQPATDLVRLPDDIRRIEGAAFAPENDIIINADPAAPYGALFHVIDRLHNAGYLHLTIITPFWAYERD